MSNANVTISSFRFDLLVAAAVTGWAGTLFLFGFILGVLL